jgi:hypothetical protein
MKVKTEIRIAASILVLASFLLHGCTTAWEDSGTFLGTARSTLDIESTPNGQVFLNNKYVGDSPLEVQVVYTQEVQRKTRKVSYWVTQPGWSLLLTIGGLGTYLPFSLIPVDIETSLERLDSFKDNEFDVRVVRESYYDWEDRIVCSGQDKVSLRARLKERR